MRRAANSFASRRLAIPQEVGRLARMSDQTTPMVPTGTDGEPDYGEAYYVNYWGGGGPYERNARGFLYVMTVVVIDARNDLIDRERVGKQRLVAA